MMKVVKKIEDLDKLKPGEIAKLGVSLRSVIVDNPRLKKRRKKSKK